MDAKRLADKYIERGGYALDERSEKWVDDLRDVLSFIVWHDDNDLRGGVRAADAFRSACRLLNLEPHEMRRIIRGEPRPTQNDRDSRRKFYG